MSDQRDPWGQTLTILIDFACGYKPESDYDAFVHAMACPTCGDE